MNVESKRLKIIVTTSIDHIDLDRLCPGRKLRWNDHELILNPAPGTSGDFWIVFAGSRGMDYMRCGKENTLFIAGEPPTKKVYGCGFYEQFFRVVSCNEADPHPRVVPSAPGLNWHAGLSRETNTYQYGYDELVEQKPAAKKNKISVICSNLKTTEGQRQRLAFLSELRHHLGDNLVHYGRGFDPIDDKMNGITPFRFHLVLENSCVPDYWTEKLSDAYLGWAWPVYVGCPNLSDYFPESNFTAVDITKPEEAAVTIRDLLSCPATETEHEKLRQSRDLILNTYNPFARFAYWAEKFYQPDSDKKTVRIRSHKAFRPFPRGIIHRVKTRIKGK